MRRFARSGGVVIAVAVLAILAWRVLSSPPPSAPHDDLREGPTGSTASGPASEPDETTGETTDKPGKSENVIRGRVVGPHGEPLPDAKVAIRAQSVHGFTVEIAKGRSGPTGEFALTIRPTGLFIVVASSPGLVAMTGDWLSSGPRRDVDAGTLRLTRGLAIAGRVVDPGGRPLAAEVTLEIEADPVPEWWEALQFSTDDWRYQETGEDGSFRFSGVPAGTYRIAVEVDIGEDWVTYVHEHVATGTEDVLVVLPAGPTPQVESEIRIRARVLDPDGRPVPGGQYAVNANGGWMSGPFVDGTLDESMEGRWPAWVVFYAPVDAEKRPLPYAPARVKLTKATDEPVEIRLRAGLEVAGRVFVDGEPGVADLQAEVDLPGEGGARSVTLRARSAEDGTFVFTGLPPGPVRVGLPHGSGFLSMPTVDVEAGDRELTIRVRRAGTIKWTVRAPEGKALVRAEAIVFERTAGGLRWMGTSSTGTRPRDGWSFEAGSLDPERRYEIVFVTSHPGGRFAPTRVRDLAPGGPDLEIVPSEGQAIEGVVRREDGSPVAGASVRAVRAGAHGGEANPYSPDLVYGHSSGPIPDPATLSRVDGRFRLGGLEGGDWLLVASAPGLVRLADPAPARSGESGVTLVLGAARTISGRIVDETGGAPDEIEVEAWPEGGAPELVSRVRVRHDGFFETNMLGSGRYRLIARGYHEDDDGRIGVSPPIEAGTRDVRLALRRAEGLRGVVRDANGAPVDGARVDLRGLATARHGVSARDGTFRFRCLLPGRYRLRASVTGPPPAAVEREVAAGGPGVVLVVGTE